MTARTMMTGLGAAAFLAACAMPPEAPATALTEAAAASEAQLLFPSEFNCSGKTGVIGVLNEQTVLRVDGRDYVLEQTETASGAKYVWAGTPETSFWSKGEGGLLTLAGVEYPDCVRTGGYLDHVAVAPVARMPGLWRARGNEPGWLLTMDGETMTLSYDYGQGTLSIAEPHPAPIPGGMRWDGGPLTVTAMTELCSDNMTGMPYPASVTVEFSGRTLRGCGGETVSLLTGDEWQVAELNGGALAEGTKITLAFDGNAERIAGTGGCNRYNAGYDLTGEGISFGPAMSTQMACADPAMAQERVFLDTLGAITNLAIDETGALVLTGGAEHRIVARR
ncbi:META domain-containing protein [Hyphomonas sp.]|uniref:META domain-containing protein n=1 Tax=Hyphomonas sp. TaxID=87 RepID=UPI003918A459